MTLAEIKVPEATMRSLIQGAVANTKDLVQAAGQRHEPAAAEVNIPWDQDVHSNDEMDMDEGKRFAD